MFEADEVGSEIDKKAYERELPKLRAALLSAQTELATARLSVVVVIGGVEGAGKTEVANELLEWLDARGVQVHAVGAPSDEEAERPFFWRFWRSLPPHGRMAIFIGSWYSQPVIQRTFERLDDAQFDEAMDQAAAFEKMLANERTLVVKLWLHLAKNVQRKRLKELERDPATSWRVTKRDWKFAKNYDAFREVCEQALTKTSTAECPWRIVEATDRRYRDMTVARILLDALTEALASSKVDQPKPTPEVPKPRKSNVINRLDMTKSLEDDDYEEKMARLQGRFGRLTRKMYAVRRSMAIVFEGPDAAGKGGAIRRLTHAMDARHYQVISTAAPTDEERAHPYLWRFWRHLPRQGRVTIYDRSWYGRVLVERLEGFCRRADWQRAYAEIDQFEAEMAMAGIVIVKFWIALTPEEQLKRFKDRETTPYKQYKIGPDDWRNRAKWDAYEAAACDMIERTSTTRAPWVLVEGNDKRWARAKVMKTVCKRLEDEIGGTPNSKS